MRLWIRASKRLKEKQARQYLVQCWFRFSEGKASKQDFEVIMADLANHSGFFQFNDGPPDTALAQFEAGKRSVFGRAFSFLTMTQADKTALAQAALEEARAQQGVEPDA